LHRCICSVCIGSTGEAILYAVFARLIGVYILVNVGSSGARLDSFCCSSGQLHRHFGFACIGLTGVVKVRFQASLDNCTGVIIDLIGLSGVRSSVEPTLSESIHRINLCCVFPAAGSVHRLNRRFSK